MFLYYSNKKAQLIFYLFIINLSLIYLYGNDIYQSIFFEKNFDWYREMSRSIFFKCGGYYCESPLIPIIANLLNLYETQERYNFFNVILIFLLLNINKYLLNKYYSFFKSMLLIIYLLFTLHLKSMFK